MGKYMKKVRYESSPAAVGVMEVGVLTRAKTLALKRDSSSYLQLRSRRLEKPSLNRKKNPNHLLPLSKNNKHHLSSQTKLQIDAALDPCFRDKNHFASQPNGRRTRESTPCDLIISADNVKPPASTIKQRTPIANQSTLTAPSNSTTLEMEDLLARMEQSNKQDQQRFIERYNFDVVNDKPLPGRYEWEAISP